MTPADDQGPVSPPVGVADGTTGADGVGDSSELAGRGWRNSRLGRAGQVGVSLALVIVIFWYILRQFADLSEVWAAIQSLTGLEIAALVVATLWNLITYWIVVVIATPGLTFPQAMVLTQSTTAVSNTVPAGGAVGIGLTYTMLSSWGFSKSRSTLSIMVTGVWNNFVKLGMPVLALAILLLQGKSGGGRTVAALAGLGGLVAAIVVFALILRSEDFATRAGLVGERWMSSLRGLVRKGPVHGWDIAVTKFRGRIIGLVRQRWIALTVSTLVGHLSLFAVLLISLRAMGVSDDEVGWAEVLATFAFARLLTAIPLTPGGVGVVELALIAGLTAAGGDDAETVAAVLIFRLLTYVFPIAFGACTYLYWRRNRSWLNSAPPLPMSIASVSSPES